MQDDNIEHKIVVEGNSPRPESEEQADSQHPPSRGLLSVLYGLVSPRDQSPSPASRQMEERQQEEIKQHKEEIRRLREELLTKKHELTERIAEIVREREERHRERELQRELSVAAPPDYTGAHEIIIHPPVEQEAKLLAEHLPELSVPHSDPEQTNDDVSVFDAAADELLESKLSTESSQQRFNEERIAQQQQQIDELNQEITRLQQENNERLRKEVAEVERLNHILEEERKRAAEVLENERRRFEEIMRLRTIAYAEQAELARRELQEANLLRQRQAQTQQELEVAQRAAATERENRARADAQLLLNQEQSERLRVQQKISEKAERDRQASAAQHASSLGI